MYPTEIQANWAPAGEEHRHLNHYLTVATPLPVRRLFVSHVPRDKIY
jgi:hypothetical protein